MRRSLLTALSPRSFLATMAERVKTTLKKPIVLISKIIWLCTCSKLFGTFESESSTVMLTNPNLNLNLKMNTNLYTFIRYYVKC